MATVVLLGSLDTKGEEYRFARDELQALGIDTVVVDTATVGSPAFTADVGAAEVASAGGGDLEALRAEHDRAASVAAMSRGAAVVLTRLLAAGRLDGAFALGGSGTTTVASAAFRSLPLGVPKLILSTMVAAGNVRAFVGDSDMILAASVVDIAGLNRISRTVIANAAAAVAGMVTARTVEAGMPGVGLPGAGTPSGPGQPGGEDRPLIAASMIGLTTRAVTAGRERLEELGYEVVVFHMTGAGGATMESLIARGLVVGVLDLTTSELADELGGGVCSAGPDRLRTAARVGLPQVVAPGGLDMINFGARDTVPARYDGRALHVHNAAVTLVRTDAAESAELGRRLVERVQGGGGLPGPGGRPVVLLPTGGLSAIDVEGPFSDATADAALAAAARATADPARVRIVEVDGDLDTAAVGLLAADLLHEQIRTRAARPELT